MTKEELVEKLSERTGITKKKCLVVVNTFYEPIREALARGEKVTLQGFGVFDSSIKKCGVTHLPKNGIKRKPTRKRYPAFRTGKNLNQIINLPQ